MLTYFHDFTRKLARGVIMYLCALPAVQLCTVLLFYGGRRLLSARETNSREHSQGSGVSFLMDARVGVLYVRK